MEHKKKAWIVTAFLLFALFSWALMAVHDSAVAAARAARANKTNAPAGCPFSKTPSPSASPSSAEDAKKSTSPNSCCHSKKPKSDPIPYKPLPAKKAVDFAKFADMNDKDIEELKKQFTPEQLAKCPHLKARSTNKKK